METQNQQEIEPQLGVDLGANLTIANTATKHEEATLHEVIVPPTLEHHTPVTNRIRRRAARVLTAVLATATFGTGTVTAESNAESYAASLAEEPPLQANQTKTINVQPNSILIGNLASIGQTSTVSWSAVYGEYYAGTSVTNSNGTGHVSANAFFADTGPTGKINVLAGVGPQHEVVDAKIYLPKNPGIQMYPNPVRTVDTRTYSTIFGAKDTLVLNYGPEKAGKTALINITVDKSSGAAWYAAFPCNEGYNGTSSVNTSGKGATPTAEVVRIDSDGKVCIIGNKEAAGIIVDTFGFTDWKLQAPKRILDTRELKQTLQPGQERIIETGIPNALFIGKLAIDNASGAGWFSAYPAATGYQGDSLVNPDGKSATSGLMIIATDAAGRVAIQGNVAGDLIIDQAGIIPLKDLGIDPAALTPPKRLLDTRQAQVLEGTQIISGTGRTFSLDNISFTCTYREDYGQVYPQFLSGTIRGVRPDPTPNNRDDDNGNILLPYFTNIDRADDIGSDGYVRNDGIYIHYPNIVELRDRSSPETLEGYYTINIYDLFGRSSLTLVGTTVLFIDIPCSKV